MTLNSVVSTEVPCLSLLADCYQLILFDIAQFLAASPHDIAVFCSLLSRGMAVQLEKMTGSLWREMHRQRWPPFYDWLAYSGSGDWCSLYQGTLLGCCRCILEVFHREKRRGFAMSALPAHVRYCAGLGAYVAEYLSASPASPEVIPAAEAARLRFCPAPARSRLLPRPSPAGEPPYPYRVLEGTEGLVPGRGVELQWKMQRHSPFGWWFGWLEELRQDEGGATATITFSHFPVCSPWHRLTLRLGGSEPRPCLVAGFSGGIRPTSQAEQERWMSLLPTEDPARPGRYGGA